MPKRWEHELDRLNDLSAPASVRDRISSGSHGDGPDPSPNRRQRVIAGVVAFVLFALALAFTAKAFGGRAVAPAAPPDPTAVVLTFSTQTQSGSSYPNATMTFEGAVVQGNGSTFSWNDGNSHMIADTFGTELQFDHWVVLPAGAPIDVDGTADTVQGWVDHAVESYTQPSRLYELPASGAQVPPDAGKYILEFTAQWPQGGRTFYFPIKVVSGEDVGAAITVQADPDPTASLSYQGVVAPSETAAYCWGNGQSPTCFDGDAGPFGKDQYLEIPQGTALNVYPGQEVDSSSVALYIGDDPSHQTGPAVSVGNFDSPGSYILILTATWQQGDVQFFFPVRVVAAEAHPVSTGSAPPTEAEPQASQPVPTVSPIPSGGSTIAVPDVVGLSKEEAKGLLTDAGFETSVRYSPVPSVAVWVVASTEPPAGASMAPGSTVVLQVSGNDVPVDGFLDGLPCGRPDMLPFVHEGGVDEPSAPLYITVNVPGLRTSDTAKQVGYVSGGAPTDGTWEVSRDGRLIAMVAVPSLDGIACRGSGIGGV